MPLARWRLTYVVPGVPGARLSAAVNKENSPDGRRSIRCIPSSCRQYALPDRWRGWQRTIRSDPSASFQTRREVPSVAMATGRAAASEYTNDARGPCSVRATRPRQHRCRRADRPETSGKFMNAEPMAITSRSPDSRSKRTISESFSPLLRW